VTPISTGYAYAVPCFDVRKEDGFFVLRLLSCRLPVEVSLGSKMAMKLTTRVLGMRICGSSFTLPTCLRNCCD
jgi:hypothetical protein